MKKEYRIILLIFIIVLFAELVWASWYVLKSRSSTKHTEITNFQSPQNKLEPVVKTTPSAWTLLLTGDIIPARSVNYQMVKRNDFMWPLRNISGILSNADITLTNLESPLLEKCELTNTGMSFCGGKRFVNSLVESGIDVVNLANNHSLNRGWEGLAETEKYLGMVEIDTTGFTSVQLKNSPSPLLPREGTDGENYDRIYVPSLKLREGQASALPKLGYGLQRQDELCYQNIYCSRFTIKTVQNFKVGFLGYNGVGQEVKEDLIKQQISQAKGQVDVLVVSIHWGKEYVTVPEPADSVSPDPKILGKQLIDWGGDIIAGNHPHWVQPIEWYKDKPIFYALSNTVFDQMWSEETKKGILVKLHFKGKEIIKDQTEIFPIGIRNYGEAYLNSP